VSAETADLGRHVDIREVSLRDGLQIETPIPLSAKLELLAAVALVASPNGAKRANVGRPTEEATAQIADTIGTATPRRVVHLVEGLRPLIGEIPLGAHFHNTRGTGLASAYAAVGAGVTRLDASVGGLGGCPFAPGASGNIATEDLVYLLRDSDIDVDVDLRAAIDAAGVARDAVGHDLPSALLRAGDRIGGG
jgi:isopropylmalate/homocitrate/citramalate synthase